jgi:hypothetical protein
MLRRAIVEVADIATQPPQARSTDLNQQCGFGLHPSGQVIETLTNQFAARKRTKIT